MARFALKVLAVMALVCLVFDWSHGENAEQQGTDIQKTLYAAKEKVTEFMNSFKKSASDTYNNVQNAVKEPENTKKVESQLSNIFSGAFSKLKSTFSSSKTTTNMDELTKQEAIKAFDDYADKHQKKF